MYNFTGRKELILYQQRKRLKLPTNEILKMNTASMYTSVYNEYSKYVHLCLQSLHNIFLECNMEM